MTEHDRTRQNNRRLFDPFWPFWGSIGYVGISFSAQYEAEVLADVPAAEVAVLEDERMAGNMQVAGIPLWRDAMENIGSKILDPGLFSLGSFLTGHETYHLVLR